MTVRVDTEMVGKLDAIAASMDRDRSWVVKEALDEYVQMHEWQLARIQQGLQDLDQGRVAPQEEVDRAFAHLLRRR